MKASPFFGIPPTSQNIFLYDLSKFMLEEKLVDFESFIIIKSLLFKIICCLKFKLLKLFTIFKIFLLSNLNILPNDMINDKLF